MNVTNYMWVASFEATPSIKPPPPPHQPDKLKIALIIVGGFILVFCGLLIYYIRELYRILAISS